MANDHNNKSVSGTPSSLIRANGCFGGVFLFTVTLLWKSCKTFTKLQQGSQGWAQVNGRDYYTGQMMKVEWSSGISATSPPPHPLPPSSPPICKWVTFRRSPSGSGSRWAVAVMGLEVGLNKYPMDWNLPSQGGYMTAEKRPQKPKSRSELTCVIN